MATCKLAKHSSEYEEEHTRRYREFSDWMEDKLPAAHRPLFLPM